MAMTMAMLMAMTIVVQGADALTNERNRAFDLLDALTVRRRRRDESIDVLAQRSGALPLAYCTLHVMMASTQVFEKSLMQTVFHDNIKCAGGEG